MGMVFYLPHKMLLLFVQLPCIDDYEYEIDISNEWELLPTLMKWQRHVSILESFGEIDIKKIYKNILELAKKRV